MEETWELTAVSEASKPGKSDNSEDVSSELQKEIRERSKRAQFVRQQSMLQTMREMDASVYRHRTRVFGRIATLMMAGSITVLFALTSQEMQEAFEQLIFNEDGSWSVLKLTILIVATISSMFVLVFLLRSVDQTVLSDDELSERLEDEESSKQKVSANFFGMGFSYSKPVPKETNEVNEIDDEWSDVGFWSWEDALQASKERLVSENKRIAARSSANLRNGIITSVSGIIFIGVSVFFPQLLPSLPTSVADGNGIAYFVQRLSLFLVIQVLAGFFLRLYVGGERSIERNIRELTNLDYRLAAGLMLEEQDEHKVGLATAFVAEERCGDKGFKKTKGEPMDPGVTKIIETLISKIG